MQNERFIKTPKFLFEGEYRYLSNDAKLLYSLLLDRVSLSAENGFYDKDGNVYIIYTRKEISEKLTISIRRVVELFKQLKHFGLVQEKRSGLGKPNLLYIQTIGDVNSRVYENDNSRVYENATQEFTKTQPIKTEYNKTDNNKTESQSDCQKTDGLTDEIFLEKVKQNCELEIFSEEIGNMFERAIERIYYSDTLKVDGAVLPQSKLRSILTELTVDALIHVHDNILKGDIRLKRPMPYIMSSIINAISECTI